MTQHTPGPWYARRTHSDGYVTHVVSLDAEPVEDEFYYGRNIAAGLSGNDARLVAAAPSLLAACEQVLAIAEDRTPGTWDDAMRIVRAAIAHARGTA